MFAGPAALGLFHLVQPSALGRPIEAAASGHAVQPAVAIGVAYVTIAACGALVGGLFAAVTKYLKRFFPILVWAELFFVSLTLLVVALLIGRHDGLHGLAPAILGASAVYAAFVSLALAIRLGGR